MPDVLFSINMTVSGDSNPCAVGKEGSVSLRANTDCDSVVDPCLGCWSLSCRELGVLGAVDDVGDDFGKDVVMRLGS